jgi:hypothetical protein
MGKTWVLDTETKGTGANMVPLEKVLERPDGGREDDRMLAPRKGRRRAPESPPSGPPRFTVVDLLSREALVRDADGRTTIDALKGVRSVVDVTISRWDYAAERWRALSLDERRALWALRDR